MRRLILGAVILIGCQPATEFTLHFHDAHGLKERAPIVYAGATAGTVVSVTPAGNGVDAKIRVVHDTPLYREARYFVETVGGKAQITVRDVPGSRTPVRDGEVFDGAEPLSFTIQFGNAHGLQQGAPVLYRGVTVGTVTDVVVAGDGVDVKVTAILDAGQHLYRDATYRIVTENNKPAVVVTGDGTALIEAGAVIEGTNPLGDTVTGLAGKAAGAVSRAIDAVTK